MIPDNESSVFMEYFKKKIEVSLKEFKPVEGLDESIFHIINFKDLINLKTSFRGLFFRNNSNSLKLGGKIKKEEIFKVNLIKIAYQTLNDSKLYPFFKKDLINFPDFYFLYKFLELSYFLSLERKLRKEDLQKLYFSGLDEIIIQKMDHFDEDLEIFEIKDDFFIQLKNLKWNTKDTERFFLKLNNVKTEVVYDISNFSDDEFFSARDFPSEYNTFLTPSRMIPTFPPLNKKDYLSYILPKNRSSFYPNNPLNIIFMPFENPYLNLPATENAFILFLSGCSAVNDNRSNIDENDIINAYKTHYKILTTDLFKLVDKLWEERSKKENYGYLVCEKCNQYYKLLPGESPEDFTDKCECGGKLEHYEDINWLLKE